MAFDTTHDIVPDSPTNTFATLNPLLGTSNGTFNDGNLKITTTANGTMNAGSTISIPHTKKWYIEFVLSPTGIVGISKDFTLTTLGTSYGLNEEGRIYINGTDTTGANSGRSWTSGDIISLLIDPSASNSLSWYKNGTTSNDLIHQVTYDLTTASFFVITSKFSSSTYINFGQDHTFGGYPNSLASSSGYSDAKGIGKFYYDPPTGALALCTANLPDPAIDPNVDDLPEDYFKCVKYNGVSTGGGNFAVPVGFQSDLIWIKRRNNGNSHNLFDSVRGFDKWIISDFSGAERNNTSNNSGNSKISTVNSSGFTVHDNHNAEVNDGTAGSASQYISWNWKAGGAPTHDNTAISGPMNANGSIATSSNSSVSLDNVLQSSYTPSGSPTIYPTRMSIGAKQGFSIIKYIGNNTAGATIPHGLSSAPEFVIIKNLTDSVSAKWGVFHKDSISSGALYLDGNAAAASADTNVFNSLNASTISTINTITIGNYNGTNGNGDEHIMYCWNSVPGYSAFGLYTGNGSATDGPFVYTGFKPAWVMIKLSSTTTTVGGTQAGSWAIFDNVRSTNNPVDGSNVLWANQSSGEGTRGSGSGSLAGIETDFLSNGFKIKNSAAELNLSGETFIYSAFAEMPSKYAATNAR